MKFGQYWSNEELLMLALLLRGSHGSYAYLTRVYGELLVELDRRELLEDFQRSQKCGT